MVVFCHSCVIDTAVAKIGDFVVDFLREFQAMFKKTLALFKFNVLYREFE
jgi:hypothetical protein